MFHLAADVNFLDGFDIAQHHRDTPTLVPIEVNPRFEYQEYLGASPAFTSTKSEKSRPTAQLQFESDYKEFLWFCEKYHDSLTWQSPYEISPNVIIPDRLVIGPWTEEDTKQLFWLVLSGARSISRGRPGVENLDVCRIRDQTSMVNPPFTSQQKMLNTVAAHGQRVILEQSNLATFIH
jgi:hypothetical protein